MNAANAGSEGSAAETDAATALQTLAAQPTASYTSVSEAGRGLVALKTAARAGGLNLVRPLRRGTGKLSASLLWVPCMSNWVQWAVQCIVFAGWSGANALQGRQESLKTLRDRAHKHMNHNHSQGYHSQNPTFVKKQQHADICLWELCFACAHWLCWLPWRRGPPVRTPHTRT